jgi:hypothetical protein
LTSWQENGLYAAGQKYLDPSQRADHQTQGDLVLIAGTVTHTQPQSWVSADHFTVMADLDLRFSKEDAAAWGNGVNTSIRHLRALLGVCAVPDHVSDEPIATAEVSWYLGWRVVVTPRG